MLDGDARRVAPAVSCRACEEHLLDAVDGSAQLLGDLPVQGGLDRGVLLIDPAAHGGPVAGLAGQAPAEHDQLPAGVDQNCSGGPSHHSHQPIIVRSGDPCPGQPGTRYGSWLTRATPTPSR